MSSSNLQANKGKRERACDGCRRRKTKCDGPWMQRNICTNCIQTRKACTYLEASKPRGPPKAYITRLEDRLEVLESLLQQLCPDTDFSEELGPPVIRGSWKANLEPTVPSTSQAGTVPASSWTSIQSQPKEIPTPNPLVSPRPHTTHLRFPRSKRSRTIPTFSSGDLITDSSSSSSDTEEMLATSSKGKMKINLLADEPDDIPDETAFRVSSTSSTGGLVEALRKLKNMHIGETMNSNPAQFRRPLFWQTPAWEHSDSTELLPRLSLYFPPTDLAETLLNLYFAKSNSVFPLLHRPTFDRQWRDGLHRRNVWFTCVCVCLFAVASRWCDDERVLPEGSRREDGELDWQKAGRQYFDIGVEIHRIRRNFFQPPSLFELQTFPLMSMYLRGTNVFPVAWITVSVGIRRAQDAGAHSKKIYRANPNADDELWKRAFWHLVVFDRLGGVGLGRPFSIAEEDFDLDLPLEVDDEYWDTDKTFEQPSNILSRIAAFNHFIKLTQIMAFTVRTMYAVNKSKTYCGIIPTDRESLVQQLSSALKEWLETLPEHLKWRDNMNNPELSMQSATLFSSYYLALLLIHRPLITPSPPSLTTMPYSSELPPPMLSTNPAIHICTDAARSCARIVEVQLRDGLNNCHIPAVINAAYVCAGLLSYRIWNLKVQEETQQCEYPQDVKPLTVQIIEEYTADARIFVRALERVKLRWEVVDSILEELNASLPGVQSQSPSIPDSPRSNNTSHLGPISDGHPCPSAHASCPMDIPPGQSSIAQQLKYNQHLLRVSSFSGIEHWAHLQLSQNIPTYPPNTNEPRLHSHNPDAKHNQPDLVAMSSRPRSLSALPSYIPEHPLSYATNSLRRTSFSNLHARESHKSHNNQPHTGVEYPLSLPTPTESCFSIGGSTVNNIHFVDEVSSHHHQMSARNQSETSFNKRGFNSLERKCLPASATGPDRSIIHMAVMPPDPSTHNIYDPPCNGQNFYHPAYSS